jgi:hypothetical protein
MGFQRVFSILIIVIYTNFDAFPVLQYPKTHFSGIPAFHYSNLGKARNLKKLQDKRYGLVNRNNCTGC